MRLADADTVVGTSAGSVVGFSMASGIDLSDTAALVAAADGSDGGAGGAGRVGGAAGAPAEALAAMMSLVAEASAAGADAEEVRARLGAMAAGAETISDERWLGMFSAFEGQGWPEQFRCTAVDTASGEFRVWGAADGVPANLAIASSCAVPGVFPPVAIGGRLWMDGGVRDMLNADIVDGSDTVVAVSCTLLEIPEGLAAPEVGAVLSAARARLDGLRRGGSTVEVILPGDEMLAVSGWGLELMDASKVPAAYDAGFRQAAVEASRLAAAWT